MSTTRPLSLPQVVASNAATPAARSSWLLRILFALLFIVLAIEALIVTVLVGYAALLVRDQRNLVAVLPPEEVRSAPLPVERTVEPAVDEAGLDVWDKHGPLNILLLGLDHDTCDAPDEEHRRSDTVIVVRIDPATSRAAMLALPRDLFVHVDGYGGKKLAVAHYLGALYGYEPHGGPGLAKRAVRDNLEISVHRYIRVDFDGFKRIIDALGPLTIHVPPNRFNPTIGLYDTDYPDGRCGTITINFPPGEQKFDGENALQYARSRKSTSDFDRSRRQMQVLEALRKQGTSLGVVLDLPALLPALMDTVDTDLSTTEIVALARVARRMNSDSIVRMALDENYVYDDSLVIDGVTQSILRYLPGPWRVLRQRFLDIEGMPSANTRTESAAPAIGEGDRSTTPDPAQTDAR